MNKDASERSNQGNTVPAQGETEATVPRQPHERDESADSQAGGEPSGKRMGSLGQKDMERGGAETAREAAMDATYTRLRESTDDPVKKRAP